MNNKTEVSVGTWIRVGKEVVDIAYKFLAAPKVDPKDKCFTQIGLESGIT